MKAVTVKNNDLLPALTDEGYWHTLIIPSTLAYIIRVGNSDFAKLDQCRTTNEELFVLYKVIKCCQTVVNDWFTSVSM